MSNVLLVSGHPNLNISNANKVIVNKLKELIPGIEVSDLGVQYPDGKIDVAAEQAKLVKADTIIWQFPLYWFATPGIFKQWMDDVLLYGFAYGSTGDKLHGKKVIVSVTAGAGIENYNEDGRTVADLMAPIVRSIAFCGMECIGCVTEAGMLYMPGVMPEEVLASVQDKAVAQAERVAALVK
uniref:NAD(P)H-dependent oxidoreductase n=3 Tax=unclassified Prevotella TaxID=2638335 RepID=A0AB33JCQ4_9BACT